jgi:uncharacterized repeat protein (TIGR03943 family)
VRRDAQAVLLLLVGGTLLKIGLTGTYVRYVKPGALPLLLAGGAVLVVVAVATLYREWSASRRPSAHQTRAHAGHGHGHDTGVVVGGHPPADGGGVHLHGEPRVGWLLLVPALALLMFAPPAIGSFQADRSGTALGSQADSDFPPLPSGDPVRISLLDYAGRAVFDHGQSLTGRTVTLSGFIMAGPHGQPYLARMVVTCCAADARPVKVGLTGSVPDGLKQDQWVEVVGSYLNRADEDTVNGGQIPYLQVNSLRNIAAPQLQYES